MDFQTQAAKARDLRKRAVEKMYLATQQLKQKKLDDARESLTIVFNSLKKICHQGDSMFILCLLKNVSMRIEIKETLLPSSQACLFNALHGQSLRYRHDSDMQQVYSLLNDCLKEMIEKSLAENLDRIKSIVVLMQEIEELYQRCGSKQFRAENKKMLATIFSQIFPRIEDLPTLSARLPNALLADVNFYQRYIQLIKNPSVTDTFEENLATIEELVKLGNLYYLEWQPTHHPTHFIQFALLVIEKAIACVEICKRMIPNDSSEQSKEQLATLTSHASSLRSSFTFFNRIHFIHQEAKSAIERAKKAGDEKNPTVIAVEEKIRSQCRTNENSVANSPTKKGTIS